MQLVIVTQKGLALGPFRLLRKAESYLEDCGFTQLHGKISKSCLGYWRNGDAEGTIQKIESVKPSKKKRKKGSS